jgi:hypothetical protein
VFSHIGLVYMQYNWLGLSHGMRYIHYQYKHQTYRKSRRSIRILCSKYLHLRTSR